MTCALTSHTAREIRGQAAGLVVLSFPGTELKATAFATNTHHHYHSSTGARKGDTWQSIGTHQYQEAYLLHSHMTLGKKHLPETDKKSTESPTSVF